MDSHSTNAACYSHDGIVQRMNAGTFEEIYDAVLEGIDYPGNTAVVVTGRSMFTQQKKDSFTERLLEDGETQSLINFDTFAEITQFNGQRVRLFFIFDCQLIRDFVEFGNEEDGSDRGVTDESSDESSTNSGELELSTESSTDN